MVQEPTWLNPGNSRRISLSPLEIKVTQSKWHVIHSHPINSHLRRNRKCRTHLVPSDQSDHNTSPRWYKPHLISNQLECNMTTVANEMGQWPRWNQWTTHVESTKRPKKTKFRKSRGVTRIFLLLVTTHRVIIANIINCTSGVFVPLCLPSFGVVCVVVVWSAAF